MSPCAARSLRLSSLITPENPRSIGRGLVLLIAWSLGFSGCELFDKSPGVSTTTARKLPTLQAAPGAIWLEVVYVERPVGDPRLGDRLWRHVDQVGPVDAEGRALLRKNGLRVGLCGANPPVELQQMLGLKSDFIYEPEAEQAKQYVGQKILVVSGGETEIQVSPAYPECTLNVESGDSTEMLRFANAVCKFRVRAVRLQEGWVRLEFVPQIHFGDDKLHYAPGESDDWRFQSGQQTETLFLKRFEVKLSTGDMALLTADEDVPGTLGQLFFRGPAGLRPAPAPAREGDGGDGDLGQPQAAAQLKESPIQRLFVIRLAGMDDSAAPNSKRR